MIVYFDTVRRKRPVKQGGELVQLDWSTKKVLKKMMIFPADPDVEYDPNPRGNTRGGKGILVNGAEIFVGTYHTILVFDHHLNLKRKITNNLFSNIHEMCFAGKNIWVSSTTIDCAVLVSPGGKSLKSWWPREEPLLQEKYGLFPMEIDKKADNRMRYVHAELEKKESHTHLNSVSTSGGNTYVLLNRLGVLVQIEPQIKIILEDQFLRGGHSPVVTGNGDQLILCGSFRKDILFYDLRKKSLIKKIHLLDFDEVGRLHKEYPDEPFNKSIFVRGLEMIDPGRILVGIAPASILEIDINRNKLLDFYQYSRDVGDAIHGLVHLKKREKSDEGISP